MTDKRGSFAQQPLREMENFCAEPGVEKKAPPSRVFV
jgi:hypothetical protein